LGIVIPLVISCDHVQYPWHHDENAATILNRHSAPSGFREVPVFTTSVVPGSREPIAISSAALDLTAKLSNVSGPDIVVLFLLAFAASERQAPDASARPHSLNLSVVELLIVVSLGPVRVGETRCHTRRESSIGERVGCGSDISAIVVKDNA
jgi:hypothetical protein